MRHLLISIAAALAVIFTWAGCSSGTDTSSTALLLHTYLGKRLLLPDDAVCRLLDCGEGIASLDADYLIVSYISSTGCTPCHLKLPYWKAIADRLDTLSTANAAVLLIIVPDTLEKVAGFMRRSSYNYPVIIDTAGTFTALNNLPHTDALRTFLIDRNATVLAMGNPVMSEKIERLYLATITGTSDAGEEASCPLIINNSRKDLGTIPPSAVRQLDFLVANNSADTAVLLSVTTPCSCVGVEGTDIPPHATVLQ